MGLEEYQKKRQFDKTDEPAGQSPPPGRVSGRRLGGAESGKISKSKASQKVIKSKSQKGEGRFVIQEHDASHLHYDLRLEIEDVLKSWAVPKEPPKKPGVKRLAMRTEDHPIEYLYFEGVIPKGQYGAGTVKIWDKGEFKLDADSAKKPEDGNLVFHFSGKKLKGRYALIHTNDKNWLFFKMKI